MPPCGGGPVSSGRWLRPPPHPPLACADRRVSREAFINAAVSRVTGGGRGLAGGVGGQQAAGVCMQGVRQFTAGGVRRQASRHALAVLRPLWPSAEDGAASKAPAS